ncbi:hypothetical protein JTE90_002878 [Oedothorax gibbosus]|uniref:Uncharacterized protein n=1 Tax=Oedothorax gibbosus TaxID=931172 RepID=A0AAV6VA55_9ARAC|nr:hypothetical protein JTE90_002878 [Oedothorax gibbosus]
MKFIQHRRLGQRHYTPNERTSDTINLIYATFRSFLSSRDANISHSDSPHNCPLLPGPNEPENGPDTDRWKRRAARTTGLCPCPARQKDVCVKCRNVLWSGAFFLELVGVLGVTKGGVYYVANGRMMYGNEEVALWCLSWSILFFEAVEELGGAK